MANRVVKIHPYSSPVTIGGAQIADLGVTLVNGGGLAVIGEDVFVADLGNHTILKGRIGGAFQVIAGIAATPGSVDGILGTNLLNSPCSMCVDASKNLWFLDTGVSSINGATNLNWNSGAMTVTRTGGSWITNGFVVGMTMTVTGSLSAGNNTTYVISAVTATVLTLAAGNAITTNATDTGAAANGAVTGSSCKVRKMDANGNVYSVCSIPTSIDCEIAVDASGNLLMTDNS